MTIEIKNIDTFSLLKGIMTTIKENVSAEAYDEIEMILKNQMKEIPPCDAAGNILDDPVEEIPSDPVEQFKKRFNETCPYVLTEVHNPKFIGLINNFRNQIGEAMGPMTYAAYQLQEFLRNCPDNTPERAYPWSWIWHFVKYYEDNWRF